MALLRVGKASGPRFVLLIIALLLIVGAVVLGLSISYLLDHKYDQGFDWVSGGVIQPMAIAALGAFVLGIAFMISGVFYREAQ